MAITLKNGQAVAGHLPTANSFNENSSECCGSAPYCQKVERADDTKFQVNLTSATGTDILTGTGTFINACAVDWTCGAGWTIAAGIATLDGVSNGDLISIATNGAIDTFYKATFTITALAGGGDATLNINSQQANITANGTHTVFIETFSASAGLAIAFSATTAATTYSLDNVTIEILSEIRYEIKDRDDVVVYTQTSDVGITYGADSPGGAAVSSTKAVVCIDWTNAPLDGCYTICVSDQENGNNAEFETECFELRTTHPKTKELTYTQSQNAFGLDYSNFTFTQSLRIGAILQPSAIDDIGFSGHLNSLNEHTVLAANIIANEDLRTERAPAYVHLAIAVALRHKTFNIDAVKYFMNDELGYEAEYDAGREFPLGWAEVRVKVDGQALRNQTC